MAERFIAKIAVENAAYHYDKPYDYIIPPFLMDAVKTGCRVMVDFGRSFRQGVVLSIQENCDADETVLKEIRYVIDESPAYSEEMLLLASWLKEHTFCTYFDAFKAIGTVGMQYFTDKIYKLSETHEKSDALTKDEETVLQLFKSGNVTLNKEKIAKSVNFDPAKALGGLVKKRILVSCDEARRKTGDAVMRSIRICDDYDDDIELTPKQQRAFEFLEENGNATVKELCYYAGVGESVVKQLVKKGAAQIYDAEVYRRPYEILGDGERTDITLNDEQQKAFDGLCGDFDAHCGKTALLYGVTGSGKTSVYLRLIDRAIDNGENVIVMVPEISLTPQTLSIFHRRYGKSVAVFHSALSVGQRLDEYKRVKRGEAKIAVGTRSAVFAPFSSVGLIIIDEEQEHTYKSDRSPRFHARDVARFRAAYNKGLLLLASATPSIESLAKAKNGIYSLYTIKKRYGNAVLPSVELADMRTETEEGNISPFSSKLRDALSETLSKGEQAILLLNRRGYNTFVSCRKCGEVVNCPNCSISLTYHSANGRMMCHYCGYSEEYTQRCKKCGDEHVRFSGVGTQKAEEELKKLFPDARVLRVDADTTMAKYSHDKMLGEFAEGNYDILLGTQMVAKGLDFPRVTLVGVLNADSVMRAGDYKSYERGFDLLTQVIGRSGRSENKGKAVIQTLTPDDSVIKLAESQDMEGFYDAEMAERRLLTYPPYCDICLAGFAGKDEDAVKAAAQFFFDSVKCMVDEKKYGEQKAVLLGPSPATVKRVGGRYRYRIIIKCRNSKNFRRLLSEAMSLTGKDPRFRHVFEYIDVNPETII